MTAKKVVQFILKDIPELQRKNVSIKDVKRVEGKIKALVSGGFKQLQIVSDFDETLTKQRSDDNKKLLTSFGLLYACPSVPENYKIESQKLYNTYRPFELDETINKTKKSEIMLKWWEAKNQILRNFRLPPEELETVAKSNIILRDGVLEMFRSTYENNVPVLIFSAGLGNSINAVLKKNEIDFPNVKIISNFLNYGQNDMLEGIQQPIIHTLNKNEQALHGTEYYDLVKSRGNIILMGDTLSDIGMSTGVPNAQEILKIGFVYQKDDETLEKYRNAFDIILIDDQTMHVPTAILKTISKN